MPLWLVIVLALGGSALISTIVNLSVNGIVNGAKKRAQLAKKIAEEVAREDEVLRRGVQALLRHELYGMYEEYYTKKGYAPLDVKNDFEFIYMGYHNLGKNGVMDGIHERFMKLPEDPEDLKADDKSKKNHK